MTESPTDTAIERVRNQLQLPILLAQDRTMHDDRVSLPLFDFRNHKANVTASYDLKWGGLKKSFDRPAGQNYG